MTFYLEIKCDNAAFDPDPNQEIGRILQKVGKQFEFGESSDRGRANDFNGNPVCDWHFTGKGR